MKPSVYLETTIISYLAAWPSRDLIMAAQQQATHEWWNSRASHFELCISQAVIEEALGGDPDAARRRLELMTDLRRVDVSDRAIELSVQLGTFAQLPAKAAVDALHVAIAAEQGIGLLLTWNCRHLASATFRPRIESFCRSEGLTPPVICTPSELMGP